MDEREKIKLLSKAYKDIFGGESGKLVLEDIKDRAFMNTSTWAGNADATLINEGTRLLALHIKTMIEFDPEQLEELINPSEGEEAE